MGVQECWFLHAAVCDARSKQGMGNSLHGRLRLAEHQEGSSIFPRPMMFAVPLPWVTRTRRRSTTSILASRPTWSSTRMSSENRRRRKIPEVKQTYFWKSALCVCWEPRVFWGHPTCLPFSHCFLHFVLWEMDISTDDFET